VSLFRNSSLALRRSLRASVTRLKQAEDAFEDAFNNCEWLEFSVRSFGVDGRPPTHPRRVFLIRT
jgi:hypothetical protein